MTVVEFKATQLRRKRERRKESLIKVICLLIVAVWAITWGMMLCCVASGQGSPEYEYHTADRLWDFVKFCPVNVDRWEYLEEICELNGMDDMTVHPGRVYMVPIYK